MKSSSGAEWFSFDIYIALGTLVLLSLVSAQPVGYPVEIQDSGNEHVEKFATAIRFYVDLVNSGDTPYEITVTPSQCCLFIEENDIDCETLELKPPRVLLLGPVEEEYSGNNSGRALFLFRNLYARFRSGNCSFIISTEGDLPTEWMHSFTFDTHSNETESAVNCSGIDQDPDRGCSPVDCAIKYKGRRNFYRNTTGKCEPVADCNTRGKDGVAVVGYYDWETNVCHRFDWLEDNSFSQVESDTEIPVDVDPSRESQYFPEFEPQRLEKGAQQLQCNNGRQEGIYCVCDEGWISSGIHEDAPLHFHWCDVPRVDPTMVQHGPRYLTKPQEISAIIVMLHTEDKAKIQLYAMLDKCMTNHPCYSWTHRKFNFRMALSLGNFVMFVVWVYLVYKLCCRKKCAAIASKRLAPFCTKAAKYTQLPQE